MSQPINATSANFDSEIATGTVLVDFWATWCGPCRMQSPIVDEIAADGAHVLKVNVDEAPELAAKFLVDSIPTLVIFKDGREVRRFVGYTRKAEIVAAM